jgi:hypothetical protein
MTLSKEQGDGNNDKIWMSSQVNQAFETVLHKDETAIGECLSSKLLCSFFNQGLTDQAEIWQILKRNIVGDGRGELIGKCHGLLGELSGVSLRRGRLKVNLSDAKILKFGMAVDRLGRISVIDMLL